MVLKPKKHKKPEHTVLVASAEILSKVKKDRICGFDDLKSYVKKKDESYSYMFSYALTLLYALGVIEYREKNDSIEYIGPK